MNYKYKLHLICYVHLRLLYPCLSICYRRFTHIKIISSFFITNFKLKLDSRNENKYSSIYNYFGDVYKHLTASRYVFDLNYAEIFYIVLKIMFSHEHFSDFLFSFHVKNTNCYIIKRPYLITQLNFFFGVNMNYLSCYRN